MHFHDQHFFVVRTVEDADPAAFRQAHHAAPEKVVIELFVRGLLEAVDLAALRIDARHHVLDHAIFAGGIHRLQHDKHRPGVGGVEQFLRFGQRGHIFATGRFLRILCDPTWGHLFSPAQEGS